MTMEPDTPPTRRITVKAGKGDTLLAIAKRNHVTVADIKSWNTLPRDTVTRGQVLVLNVPNGRAPAAPAVARNRAGRPVGHKVVHSKLATAPVKSSKSGKPTKTANKSAGKSATRTANNPPSRSVNKTLLARQ
jgi:membrane-bound lytic murein transglycosylase D